MNTPGPKFALECSRCAWQGPDANINSCPACGDIVQVHYTQRAIYPQPHLPGLWRYLDHLPLNDASHLVSLGEGNTPLLQSAYLGKTLGIPELYFKLEGSNPTGSYKDRIAAVGMARLRELGKTAWAATSSGNAGAAMAAYGVRAGLEGYLFTLEKASRAKIAQIMAYGPHIMAVQRLGYDPVVEVETWANIGQVCTARDWLMLVTAHKFSPHAMDGVKTIAYEVCEQLGGTAPDVVYVPAGGGGLFAASWRGFIEAHAAGNSTNLPRMVAVQPAGCDGIAQAWARGDSQVGTISDCTSEISGLQLTAPPDGDLVLRGVQASNGWVVSVPDAETYRAQAELASREGLFVEPAAAITLAAVRADLAAGRLTGDERVACWLTGIGFKDTAAVQRMTAEQELRQITAAQILEFVEA
ncbi:MAG: threonine synthase [Litorilinea sp.]